MKQRELSYDLMRIVAIIAVIIIHVSAENWYQSFIDSKWLINNFINAFVHSWAVPLFLTISGALLLSKDISIKKIFAKYIPRILLCLIIWHFIYYFYTYRTFNISNFIQGISNLLYGKSYSHLWYLYLLIGIYILLPFIRKLVKDLDKKEQLYLLIVMGLLSIIVPSVKLFLKVDISKYFIPYKVLEFSDYIFFFIFGYFLNNYYIKNRKLLIMLLIISICVNGLLAFYGNNISINTGVQTNCGYTNTIISIFTVIVIFSFIKGFFNNKNNRIINLLGELTFGVYLVHFLIIKVLSHHGINANMINPILGNIIIVLFVTIFSYACTYLLSKIPIAKKIIGL